MIPPVARQATTPTSSNEKRAVWGNTMSLDETEKMREVRSSSPRGVDCASFSSASLSPSMSSSSSLSSELVLVQQQDHHDDRHAENQSYSSSSPPEPINPVVLKPFFIMDWLDEMINPEDLAKAQRMLSALSSSSCSGCDDDTNNHEATSTRTIQSSNLTPHCIELSSDSIYQSSHPIPVPREPGDDEEHASNRFSPSATQSLASIDHVRKELFPLSTSWSAPSIAASSSSFSSSSYAGGPQRKCRSIMMTIGLSTDGTTTTTTAPTSIQSPSCLPTSKPLPTGATTNTMNVFRKRSIALGNGWNARGLQAAKRGYWREALRCWQNALEIRIQVLGDSHLDVANTCNNIGIALSKISDQDVDISMSTRTQPSNHSCMDPSAPDDALAYLERALSIRVQHYGTRAHPQVAATIHNMGNVLQHYGQMQPALYCFDEARMLLVNILGPHHIQVGRAMVAMGHTYYQWNQYDNARTMYQKALLILEQAYTNSCSCTTTFSSETNNNVSFTGGKMSYWTEARAIRSDLQDIDKLLAAQSK